MWWLLLHFGRFKFKPWLHLICCVLNDIHGLVSCGGLCPSVATTTDDNATRTLNSGAMLLWFVYIPTLRVLFKLVNPLDLDGNCLLKLFFLYYISAPCMVVKTGPKNKI